jgi:hypothetical protein
VAFWIRSELLHVVYDEAPDSEQEFNIDHLDDVSMLSRIEAGPVNTQCLPSCLYDTIEATAYLIRVASVDEGVVMTG